MRYAAPPFILDIPFLSFRVGLCSHGNSSLQDTWQHRGRWIHAHQMMCLNADDSESTLLASSASAKNQTVYCVKWKSDTRFYHDFGDRG